MDEKPDQIIGQIEAQREELGRNLSELETRVRRSTDWKTYFDKNPMLMLGAALGGGVLLGSLVGGKRSSKRRTWQPSSHSGSAAGAAASAPSAYSAASSTSATPRRPSGPATSVQKSRINETVDNVKAALIAFGISKAKEFLTAAIPGFDQHLDEAERGKRESHSSLSGAMQTHTGAQDFRSHTESGGYRGSQGAGGYRSPETVGTPRGNT
jgi:hypothetical protein